MVVYRLIVEKSGCTVFEREIEIAPGRVFEDELRDALIVLRQMDDVSLYDDDVILSVSRKA